MSRQVKKGKRSPSNKQEGVHLALLQARRFFGGKTTALSKAIKTKREPVDKWINRGSKASYDRLVLIADMTGISIDDLSPDTPEANKLFKKLNAGKPIELLVQKILEPLLPIRDCMTQDRPIIVGTDGVLMTGLAKFKHCKSEQFTTIPAIVIDIASFFLKQGKYFLESGKKLDDLHFPFLMNERLAIGLRLKQFLGDRQGQRNDLIEPSKKDKNFKEPSELRPELDEVVRIGRADEAIARIIGLKSKSTYRSALKIYKNGILELIQALDQNQISIDKAAKIAKLSEQEQRDRIQTALKRGHL